MIEQTLNSWDVEDEEVNYNKNLIFDEKTGLYKKIRGIYNERDEPCQEILEYKLETYQVSESVKARTLWKKFGKAKNDPPGPNPAQTYLGEEIFMKFMTDEVVHEEEEKSKAQTVKCRNCQGEHFSHKCPYKDEINSIRELTEQLEGKTINPIVTTVAAPKPETPTKSSAQGSYVPPHMREDAQKTISGDKMKIEKKTLRVTNLPETATEKDLKDLFGCFGELSRTFVVTDRQTGVSRGSAYVTFYNYNDATKALEAVNGFGYEHCILQVQWSE